MEILAARVVHFHIVIITMAGLVRGGAHFHILLFAPLHIPSSLLTAACSMGVRTCRNLGGDIEDGRYTSEEAKIENVIPIIGT